MKKYVILSLILLFMVSCSKFHVTKEIKYGSALSKLKNSGILFRLPHNTPIRLERFEQSLTNWMTPYKKINNLKIITQTSRNLNLSKGEYDRFLQFSDKQDFQNYKSLGIITNYLTKNKEELDKIIADNNLDSLIIYEVDSMLSVELQSSDFSSMVVIVTPAGKNQIAYLDRQFNKYEAYEIDKHILQDDLLDHVSNRFIDIMLNFDYLRKP